MKNDFIALIGNPNCGKTTLFNSLTGTYQKTGNWTGVTVEKKESSYKKDRRIKIVDLPGIYSLDAKSEDEKVVLKFIKQTPPKVIINVLDGTNLERNLFLTTELIELGLPMVIAVNFYDEMLKNGIKFNEQAFSTAFGVPVVQISALKSSNIDSLMDVACKTFNVPKPLKLAKTSDNNVAQSRYVFIESKINQIITNKQTKSEKRTLKIDDILTHKIWGIPIFFCIVIIMYFLSMTIGGAIGEIISGLFSELSTLTNTFLNNNGVPNWLKSLVCDAIISGTGTVASFFPQILVLFSIMAIIEESGYSARVAFIMDRFFRSFGLSGKSIIPMIVSCGCNVTGIMATRTIENTNERRLTLFLTPFMPCGAKIAVFGWFSYTFFGSNPLIAASMYFLAIISVAVFGKLLKVLKPFKSNSDSFVLEMPLYRLPSVKDVFCVLWEKIKDFTTKAGMIIFIVSVALWVLQNVGFCGYVNGQVENSFLFIIGDILKYVFYPLGFGNWQATVAILSGTFAKEAVIETLRLVSSDVATLFNNEFSVYAFMAFVLLSPPCIASIATAKRELKNKKWFAFMLLFQFFAGYMVALLINTIGFFFDTAFGLILSLIIVIIILILMALFISKIKKNTACGSCKICKKGDKKCQTSTKRYTT